MWLSTLRGFHDEARLGGKGEGHRRVVEAHGSFATGTCEAIASGDTPGLCHRPWHAPAIKSRTGVISASLGLRLCTARIDVVFHPEAIDCYLEALTISDGASQRALV